MVPCKNAQGLRIMNNSLSLYVRNLQNVCWYKVKVFRFYHADGDPHFVVNVPKSNLSLCFDINGEAGDVFSLIKDKRRGLLMFHPVPQNLAVVVPIIEKLSQGRTTN